MILKQDILDYINNNYSDCLLNISLFKNTIKDDIIEIFDTLNAQKNQHQILAEKYFIETTINEYIDKINKYNIRRSKFLKLTKLKLPEQRSPEWFEMRRDKLTASSIGVALGGNELANKSKLKLIYDKITNPPMISNIHTEWGTKYEEIATLFYQMITNTRVIEFGMIPHPEFPIFGASPDGICDDTGPPEYIGRMLEIKCPTRRVFWDRNKKSDHMPHHYWMQMQGQLEVCDLDECDFLQVKLEEYNTFIDYKNDILNLDEPLKYSYPNVENYDKIIKGKTSENLPKGCTISYLKEGEEKLSYLYPKLLLSDDQYLQWIDDHIKLGYNIVETKWWKITRYEIDLVKRDKSWWTDNIEKILSYYNEFVYYRDNLKELEDKLFIPEFILCNSDDDNDDTESDPVVNEESVKKEKEKEKNKNKVKKIKKEIIIEGNGLQEFALCD